MIINYSNVHLKHDNRTILSGVNMQVYAGDMIYLTGLVGSGKSTLLSSMYGATSISAGQAMVLDHDMHNISRSKLQLLRRKVGIVHQDLKLLSDYTVFENLDFVLRATDWSDKSKRLERIMEVLDWINLSDKIHCMPHELSGGQKQCICIARAILNQPKLILADEPTGQLDAENGERVIALLNEVRKQTGCTIVVVTHNHQWPELYPGTIYKCENKTLHKS